MSVFVCINQKMLVYIKQCQWQWVMNEFEHQCGVDKSKKTILKNQRHIRILIVRILFSFMKWLIQLNIF